MTMSRPVALLATAVLACAPLTVATPAEAAATRYSSCAKLTHVYKNGVAKDKKSADRAVRRGHPRPSSTKKARKVYAANYTRLDRDRDGVACEQ